MTEISTHAVMRYRRRVAPQLSRREAREEIRELLAHAKRHREPPLWATTPRKEMAEDGGGGYDMITSRSKTESYLVVDDELCFPVNDGWVLTVITKTIHVPPTTSQRDGRSLAELEAESRVVRRQELEAKARRKLAQRLAKLLEKHDADDDRD